MSLVFLPVPVPVPVRVVVRACDRFRTRVTGKGEGWASSPRRQTTRRRPGPRGRTRRSLSEKRPSRPTQPSDTPRRTCSSGRSRTGRFSRGGESERERGGEGGREKEREREICRGTFRHGKTEKRGIQRARFILPPYVKHF